MTLGERIGKERAVRGLSQADLAEALNVSRQSVSKWETNASVPDLDKLVRLCELFEISMDRLVRGVETPDQSQPTILIRQEKGRWDVRTAIGLILIVFGLLCFMAVFFLRRWGVVDALVYSVPFLTCGVLCLIFKKRPVLACAWGLWVLMTLVLQPFVWRYGISYAVINWFAGAALVWLAALVLATYWVRERDKKRN